MSIIWKFGADVDTDQIVPGRYAPYMRPNDELGDAAFIEARPDFNKGAVPGDIIVATDNFGCGSSREYAPQALRRRQIGAIFANSFARIFYRNAVNLGIPVFDDARLVELLQQGEEASLDLAGGTLIIDGEVHELPPTPTFAQEIIDAGGIVPYVREHGRFPAQ
ncbi:MAG: homoaconitate hydratase [Anaerolineae bacterium]